MESPFSLSKKNVVSFLTALFVLCSSAAFGATATLTGTLLRADGSACSNCSVVITSPTTQVVDGDVIPKGRQFSFRTEADGDVPSGETIVRTAVIIVEVESDVRAQVSVPDTSTVDISSLIANTFSQAGLSLVDCQGATDVLRFDLASSSFICQTISIGGDITDVWGCTSGNCNTLTAASGDSINAEAADSTAPMKSGTSAPGTCQVGDFFFDTDATAGRNTYACTSANTWTLQGDGGGASIALDDLTDVTITAAADGDYLRHNGSAWVDDPINLGTDTVGNYAAGDAEAGAATSGDSATAFFSTGELERALLPAASADCAASNWVKGVDADFVLDCSRPTLPDLSDIAITAAADGDYLRHNGSAWVDDPINLGTDTVGNYAAGDAEAGAATGVACTDCVALGTETTGDYVASFTAGAGLSGSGSGEGSTPTIAVDSNEESFLRDIAEGTFNCGAGTKGAMAVMDGAAYLSWCDDQATPVQRWAALGTSTGEATLGDSATAFFSTGELERALLPAASADCAASNWAKGVDADFVLDCSRPTLPDLSDITITAAADGDYLRHNGSAWVDDPINLGTDTVGDYVASVSAGAGGEITVSGTGEGAAVTVDLGTVDHGADISGLGDDDHTQYALLAGRTGTSNDLTLSSSAGGTIYGSSVTANDLTLRANSADTTTGEINLNALLDIYPSIGAQTGNVDVVHFDAAFDVSGIASQVAWLNFRPTIDIGHAAMNIGFVSGFRANAIVDLDDNTAADGTQPGVQLFWNSMTSRVTVASRSPSSIMTLFDNSTLTATNVTAGTTSVFTEVVRGNPTLSSTGASGAITAEYLSGFRWKPTITTNTAGGAATATKTVGLWVENAANSGAGTETVTTQLGVDIEALSFGTTNIGLRNADTTVLTPTTQVIAANTDTISPTASFICLTATANRTLTSNPQISDGQEGQEIIIANCDSGAETIELADGSGLDLTALFNMDAGDHIRLIYYTAGGTADWRELSRFED